MDRTDESRARSFLRRCSDAYEALVARVLELEPRGDDEETLKWLGLAATAGWIAHAGRYADDRLEAIALRTGQRLQTPELPGAVPSVEAKGARRRVLHVATTIFGTGGHTRLIENWIRSDPDAVHSLILLDQQGHSIRSELAQLVEAGGGELTVLPTDCPLLERARRLRLASRSGFDFIVLHHHPNDAVPLVALAVPGGPPVALMNHADHVYWLGVSIADAVIEFREFGAKLSRERRGARRSLLLPMPLDLTPPAIGRPEAREQLGVSADEVVLLSIGSSYKYNPTDRHHFFRAMRRVLDANPNARLYVIGVREDEWGAYDLPRHDRIALLGMLDSTTLYVAAADLYVESFPFGSYTALFETAAQRVCPVLMFAPISHTDIARDVPLRGLISATANEDDYVAQASALIANPAERKSLAEAVARQIASVHGVDIGKTYIEPIYDQLAAHPHQVAPPPPLEGCQTEDDLCLAATNQGRLRLAVLQQISDDSPAPLTPGDLARLLILSIRIGDTRPTLAHVKGWLGRFRRSLLARRST